MKTLSQVSFSGKKVLIRVDFNVPLNERFEITDDSRIVAALPTIKKIIEDDGSAILMSHLGRPKNGPEHSLSLKHLQKHLAVLLGSDVGFIEDCVGEKAETAANQLAKGKVLLLENLRFHKSEKTGSFSFAKQLSKLADVYINDAFGTAHRAHASTSVVAQFFPNDKYFGFLLTAEIESLNLALENPKKPFTAILGGAKISGKIDVITALLEKVDNLIVGGGMAYTFAKALGGDVGKSLVENEKLFLAKQLVEKAKTKGVNLILPIDSVNANSLCNDADTTTSDILRIHADYMGLDIGKKSIAYFSDTIKKSETIIWNGPMGVFEMENFSNGTKKIAKAICDATENGAFSLVGGGDSVAAIKKFGLADKASYISTGGGAMLEYLEGKKLPGIEAILT